ncbi:hypothetical protein CkaCkLH20_12249 [Colletotrichum karsti]|uniref:Uncharacterized protein n=1 Tax=Colletotrichum karsti TaxID=1095194 RepID=A0A9P6LF81_9PEZI|nr:uncharacterized protein CkaCkLH20_12249 [Colletotrichum karsti]KAF9870285.1 hypothetical protein CkaCkLH20_12249 [Colletotrichum karsti]
MTNDQAAQKNFGTISPPKKINTYEIFLRNLKFSVPSEHATPGEVRLWLLQLLKNRKVDLVNGPSSFASGWNGAELHSMHPNHIFGCFTSHGVSPQTAHLVAGDVAECLEDYRIRRTACLAAGQDWVSNEPYDELEDYVDCESQPLLGQAEGPSLAHAKRRKTWIIILVIFILLLIISSGVLAWWLI